MHTDVNTTAELYETKIIKGWENLYREKRKRLYHLLSDYYVGHQALELGCGDGESTKSIMEKFSQLDVVDGSLEQLKKIKAMFKQVNVIHAMFEDFNPSKRYDTIFMTHILEHLDSPENLLNHVYTMLNPQGVVLVSVPNALSFHRLIGVKMGMLETPHSLNEQDILLGHRRVFDQQSMEALIRKTPFRIKKFTGLMLKPISNRQIESHWSPELIDAFFQLGLDFPEYCSEIIFVLEREDD